MKIITVCLVAMLANSVYAQQNNTRISESSLHFKNGNTHEESLQNEIEQLELKKKSLQEKQIQSDVGSTSYVAREEELRKVEAVLKAKKEQLNK